MAYTSTASKLMVNHIKFEVARGHGGRDRSIDSEKQYISYQTQQKYGDQKVEKVSRNTRIEWGKHHRVPLPAELKSADISVGSGVGDLVVAPSDDAGTLFQGEYESEKSLRSHLVGDHGEVALAEWAALDWFPYFWRFFGDCRIELNRRIPLTLSVVRRLGDIDLDLSGMRVQDIRVEYATGDLDIQLPSAARSTTATIRATIGDIKLGVPPELGARITVGSAFLGSRYVDRDVFERRGYEYVSKGVDKAENQLDLSIHSHLGDLQIVRL